MNVKVGEILSSAASLVWHNKILWLLGLLMALTSSTISFNFGVRPPVYTPGSTTTTSSYLQSTGITSLLGCLTLLVFLLVFLLVRPALEAGMIATIPRAQNGEKPTLREAWQSGTPTMWRVLGINLILVGVAAVIGAIFGVILVCGSFFLITSAVSVALSPTGTPRTPDIFSSLGPFLIALGIMFLILIPVVIILSTISELAKRAVVLDGYPVGPAWSQAWRLIKANAGKVFLLWLAQFGVGILFAIVIFIVSFALGVSSLNYSLNAGSSTAFGAASSGFATPDVPIIVTILVGILLWLFNGALLIFPLGWGAAIWTMFYRAVAPAAPTYPANALYNNQYPQGGAQPYGYNQPQGYNPGAYPPPYNQPQGYSQPGQYPQYPQYGQPQGGFSIPGQYPNAPQPGDAPTQGEYPTYSEQSGRVAPEQPEQPPAETRDPNSAGDEEEKPNQ